MIIPQRLTPFSPNYSSIIARINPQVLNQQPAMREQGFGGHFKDAPPPFISETKQDNKIERIKKPKKKKPAKPKIKTQE
tara:strand:- start:129 stop:365 length:237 start_codon:yes stop_codon:yes gene_type:complete